MKRPVGIPRKIPAWAWKWLKWRTHKGKPVVNPIPPAKPFPMFDNVNLSLLPPNAPAYAGYVDGHYKNFDQLVKKFPKARHLSIAVFPQDDADCLDVERGDATIAQSAAWVKRQHARGVKQPVLYTSVSWANNLITFLAKQGIKRNQYKLWTAHYTFTPHLCSSSCGFGFRDKADATQWTDKALGRSLDESLCSVGFLPQGQSV